MKTFLHLFVSLCLCCGLGLLSSCKQQQEVRVLLVVGGHDFEEEPFYRMMDQLPGITYEVAKHPQAYASLKPDQIDRYDVVLLYDMPKEISVEAQKDFIAMLEKGKGLVALHHAFCSYDFWPEYKQIIGGRYHHFPWDKNGEEQPPSRYKHDVAMDIQVIDKNHPVTKGVKDFRIIDEAYGGTEILETIHPLLGTDEPRNGPLVCWTHNYANAKVVTLTLGHDKQAWETPAFIQVLSQAIGWVSKK